jgi:hypothetical protein
MHTVDMGALAAIIGGAVLVLRCRKRRVGRTA